MQSYVNAAMLFFGFSGLKLNVDKSSVCWLQHSGCSDKPLLSIAETPHVRISSQAWVPTGHRWDVQPGEDLEFKRIEPQTYVTYLGSTQTHTGEYSETCSNNCAKKLSWELPYPAGNISALEGRYALLKLRNLPSYSI
jgi:hypothetical protein